MKPTANKTAIFSTLLLAVWFVAQFVLPADAEVLSDHPGQNTEVPGAAITRPIAFDTPDADKVVAALQVFPADNPWNQDVSQWPVHSNSSNIIKSIGANKPLRHNSDMGFILVPPNQKKLPVKIVGYPGESDKGPFPVPENLPIEGWPVNYRGKNVTLDDVQRDKLGEGGDRHAIIVDPFRGMLYEEEVRDVRGRQRPGLGHLGCPRSPHFADARGIAADQRFGVRGG